MENITSLMDDAHELEFQVEQKEKQLEHAKVLEEERVKEARKEERSFLAGVLERCKQIDQCVFQIATCLTTHTLHSLVLQSPV